MNSQKGDHCELLVTYVDNISCFSQDPMPSMNEWSDKCILEGVGMPEDYQNIERLDEAISALTYIKNSTSKKIKSVFDCALPNSSTPMVESYHPEMDESPILDHARAIKFQQSGVQIG